MQTALFPAPAVADFNGFQPFFGGRGGGVLLNGIGPIALEGGSTSEDFGETDSEREVEPVVY